MPSRGVRLGSDTLLTDSRYSFHAYLGSPVLDRYKLVWLQLKGLELRKINGKSQFSLEVTAGQVEGLAPLTAGLGRQALVWEEVHVASGEGGAHPVAGSVNDVHELSVRLVEPLPVPDTVEERTAGVQPSDPTQPPLGEVSNVTRSLSSQWTAQHVDILPAHSHLLHQPRHEVCRLLSHRLRVPAGRVVPGGERQWLPVHREDVEVSNW